MILRGLEDDLVKIEKKRNRANGVVELWEEQLQRDKHGVRKHLSNVVLILQNAPVWRGAIAWDEFAERIIRTKACPAGAPGPWDDVGDVQTAVWLQRSDYRLEASPALVADAVRAVAEANRIHPLRDRLNALVWDGKARLDTWTTRYLGAEDTPVHRAIGAKWMLGAVARAFEPGSQFDAALILEGEQGKGKSTAIRTLSLGFFTDELADVGSKDAAMQLHGAWIIELAELDAIGRAEASRVKSFLTRRTDRYRSPYGRHVAEHPRQCVFAGSVNHNDYLRDETGGRRFWPVRVGVIDLPALKLDAEQLWAEVVTRFRSGELAYIEDSPLSTQIADHVAERYQGDAWQEVIEMHAQVLESVSVAECLERVGVPRMSWTQPDQNRIAKILKSLGYERRTARNSGRFEKRYFRNVTGHTNQAVTSVSAQNQSPVSDVVGVFSSTKTNTHINGERLIGEGGHTEHTEHTEHNPGEPGWWERDS